MKATDIDASPLTMLPGPSVQGAVVTFVEYINMRCDSDGGPCCLSSTLNILYRECQACPGVKRFTGAGAVGGPLLHKTRRVTVGLDAIAPLPGEPLSWYYTDMSSSLEAGIRRTEARLREFEIKYQLSTEEFLRRFANDEIQHSFDFDEWIGESRMLAHLLEQKYQIQGI